MQPELPDAWAGGVSRDLMGLSAMFFLDGSLRFGFWLAALPLQAAPPVWVRAV